MMSNREDCIVHKEEVLTLNSNDLSFLHLAEIQDKIEIMFFI